MIGSFVANAQVVTFYNTYENGWNDTNGNPIEAHGAGVVWDSNSSLYYMVGEADDNSDNFSGMVFRSSDLSNWTFVGDILPVQSSGDLVSGNIVQRPKILYNAMTSTWVMWMHIDNSNYSMNHVGVATSLTPCGTYQYKGSFQPLETPVPT